MTNQTSDSYQELCNLTKKSGLISSIASVLGWDERTQMPLAAGEYRTEQLTFLAGEQHKAQTDPRIGELLASLSESSLASDPTSEAGATIRFLKRDFDKNNKLPQLLVEELARASSQGEQIWAEARKANDFKLFQPALEKTIELKRQEAAAYGYKESPYDPLLDNYEPEATANEVSAILSALVEDLVPLVQAIDRSAAKPDATLLQKPGSVQSQEAFGVTVSKALGYDYNSGRVDSTTHPFCATLGPKDIRITTRYDENEFLSALFSTLHEAGHAMYEQGMQANHFGLPLGSACSLGIHESQSRMWENAVGRNKSFWEHFLPQAKNVFPNAVGDVTLDEFYFAVNDVRPSFIRVESDEVTYNLHIIIRFELEQAMLSGDLAVADLPGAWNEKYLSYLGIEPTSDAEGCLQDVHWGAGYIGYFPTYALGNLYAAQFYEQAKEDLGDLDAMFAQGEFAPLLGWLRTNIHVHGRRYPAKELVQRVTGKPLSHTALLSYLRNKLAPLYGV